jgi:hypothetical protein
LGLTNSNAAPLSRDALRSPMPPATGEKPNRIEVFSSLIL